MPCLTENAIQDYLMGTPGAREKVEEHIDGCDECRLLVSELMRDVSQVITGTQKVPLEVEPEPPPTVPGEEPQPGALLAGRFHLLEKLGRGAMGTVFRAHDTLLGIDVAIKVLGSHVANHPRLLRHLHHEILTGRRVSHPNVRQSFDLGEADGRFFISMEFVDGRTLDALIPEGGYPARTAVRIAIQICDALDTAHGKHVVHRDLKPSNVIIDTRGHVRVMDFGLARDLSSENTIAGNSAIGTPAYWSPEQSRGEPTTPQSDLFALGVLMCELFCGESLGLDSRALVSQVPRPFRAVIRQCLAEAPEERPASASEVRRRLVAGAKQAESRFSTGRMASIVAAAALGAGAFWLVTELRSVAPVTPTAVALGEGTDAVRSQEHPLSRLKSLQSRPRGADDRAGKTPTDGGFWKPDPMAPPDETVILERMMLLARSYGAFGLPKGNRARLAKLLTELDSAYAAGDYKTAHRLLNELTALLEGTDGTQRD